LARTSQRRRRAATQEMGLFQQPTSPHPPGGLQPHGAGRVMVGERGHHVEARAGEGRLRVEHLNLDAPSTRVPLLHDAELLVRLGQALPAGLDVLFGGLEQQCRLVHRFGDLLARQHRLFLRLVLACPGRPDGMLPHEAVEERDGQDETCGVPVRGVSHLTPVLHPLPIVHPGRGQLRQIPAVGRAHLGLRGIGPLLRRPHLGMRREESLMC